MTYVHTLAIEWSLDQFVTMYMYNNASGRGEPPGVTASILGVFHC